MSSSKTGRATIALVTGGAGIMGRAAARGLIEDGHRVVLADINEEAVAAVAIELGGDTFPVAFDISNFDSCAVAMKRVVAEVGEVQVLVNNAGILSSTKMVDTTPEEWHRVMSVNLDGAFYMTKLCLPAMRNARWGRIINVSSWAAKCGGLTAGSAYSVSKAAIIGLTFSTAVETTGDGITVNGIAPAYVRTPMVEKQLTPEQQKQVMARIPVGRYCEPDEFAHVVKFLASPKAGFITGEIIDQNGGFQFD